MNIRKELRICCFSGAAVSVCVALTALILKAVKVVTETDGWTFWGIGMGLWLVLMLCGFIIGRK